MQSPAYLIRQTLDKSHAGLKGDTEISAILCLCKRKLFKKEYDSVTGILDCKRLASAVV